MKYNITKLILVKTLNQKCPAKQDHLTPPTTADELKKQKLKACVDVYNKSVNAAQAVRVGAVVGCIAAAMSNKKANGALKYVGILASVLCYLAVDWSYDTSIDLYKAQFNQCKLDAG